MSRDFVVVDLDDLLVQGDRERLAQSKALTQAFFRGTSQRPVEKLSGFRKRAHRVPDVVNRTTEAFVARVAADDLKDHVDEIFQGVRDKLGYKRSDLTPSESGIITPHFEYRVSVGLEPEIPGRRCGRTTSGGSRAGKLSSRMHSTMFSVGT
jgi:hypothetical protein